MKICISKQVYDQLGPEDHGGLQSVPCDCLAKGPAAPECDSCEGGGVVYEWSLSAEESAAIQENLRSQGVPLGKIGAQ